MRSLYSRRMATLVTCLATCLAVAAPVGCDSPPTEPEGLPDRIESLPRALTATEGRIIRAGNAFGFSLLTEIDRAAPTENHFLSPLSAHCALGMALFGARDATADAMKTALGFGEGSNLPSLEEISASYESLIDLLDDLDPAVRFDLANSVWYRPEFPFRDVYLETVRRAFRAEVGGLDFASPDAVGTINAWVNEKTEGRIPTILDRLSPADVMVLLNAIYFRGDWREKFDPNQTRDASFTLEDGTTKTVRMMSRPEGELARFRGDGYEFVDLPYGGGAFRMTIVLPDTGVRVETVLEGLDVAAWDVGIAALNDEDVLLRMPRYRLEWEKNLRPSLEALGMGVAFRAGEADFGGMLADGYDPQASGTDLHITSVRQKSFVEVNEEGTEAAAATAVTMGITSAPTPILVDRPFLVAIRERLSGTILFLGVIRDPPGA